MRKILTVARHTFRESIRKKILVVLLLFFLTVAVVSQFLEGITHEDRIKVVERVCLGAMALLSVIASISLSATSLPEEVSEKKVFNIMTKPVSRFSFLGGKVIGLFAVILLILAVMGAGTVASVRAAAKGYELKAKRQYLATRVMFEGKGVREDESQTWLFGGEVNSAVYEFRGLDPWKLQDTVRAEIRARVLNVSEKGGARRTVLGVKCYAQGAVHELTSVEVEDEKSVAFSFPRSYIPGSGTLKLEFARQDPDYVVGLKKASVGILAKPAVFEVNFAKAVILMSLEALIVIVVSVMGSTFLSSAVAITWGAFVYFCGHTIEFMRFVARTIENPLLMQGGHVHGNAQALLEAGKKSPAVEKLIKFLINSFTHIFPDLGRFDPSLYVIDEINIPFSHVLYLAGYCAIYAVAAFLIGAIVLWKREFK